MADRSPADALVPLGFVPAAWIPTAVRPSTSCASSTYARSQSRLFCRSHVAQDYTLRSQGSPSNAAPAQGVGRHWHQWNISRSFLRGSSRELNARELSKISLFNADLSHHRGTVSATAAPEKVRDGTRTSRVDVIEVLRERGLLQAVTAEDLGKKLNTDEAVTVYAGFDPTADSLHLGNLVAIMALAHFQRAGHRPIAVVGGATGLIGDPSGRKTERDQLGRATIERNLMGIEENLRRFLRFERASLPDGTEVQAAKIVNNMSWYEGQNVVEFIRDVGKHFRLGTMLAKDSVKIRLDASDGDGAEGGMSFTEFTYQIFQAYDFLHLSRSEGCRVQLGGSDQWGNITAGTDLIRKVTPGVDAFGVTLPLLTTASGEKFGKSAGNAIWLDEKKTSAYELLQYFVNQEDADVGRFLRVFTFLPLSEIDAIVEEHMKAPEKRHGQRVLARYIVELIHGAQGVERAERATAVLFGTGDIRSLTSSEILSVFKDVPSVALARDKVVSVDVASLAVAAQISKSKGEARRLIANGGLYLNNDKVTDADALITDADLLDNAVCVFRSGKKNYRLVKLD